MRHAITALLAAACLALAGCSSPKSDNDEPAKPTAAVTPTAANTTSTVDQIAACTDAIAAGEDEGDGAPECTSLSADDYMKALQDANQRGRDALSSAVADATSQP